MSDKMPLLLMLLGLLCAVLAGMGDRAWASGCVVKREHRTTVVSSEDGEISAARLTADSINGSYLLHFFTLEPNSVFLPAVLHADMVFYVHTGSGKLSWTEEDDLKSTDIRRGDVYRVEKGSIFFIHSHLETETEERQKLRIHAIFADSGDDLHEPATGPYSSIRDMVIGFDRHVLQAAFQVPDDVIDELMKGTNPPPIVHALPGKTKGASSFDMVARSLLGNIFEQNKKKKKGSSVKLFNLFKEDKDFENCNGWSTTVTRKKLSALKGTDIGLFMVNLTAGSMMGPHWNPTATEIAVVLQGRGMIQVVCSSSFDGTHCRNSRFNVEQGDVFAVPRFHPMAHISFDNETLVFAGFTTSTKRNHPQFLAGQASVLRAMGKDVLAMSFNVTSTTLDQLLGAQKDSVILGCLSCAEEELRVMEEELQREREEARESEEEEARRREEEARKREEEEAKRKEEERRQHEEEEAAAARREEQEREREREQEEAAKKEEEEREVQRKREEEEARRKEKEREKQEEEEREREEEEERKKQQEEAARRKEKEKERQEKEERRREEEQAAGEEEETEGGRSEEEQAAEAEKREEATSRREEEEARRQEEEKERGGGGVGGEHEAENVGGDGKWRVLKRLSV